MKEIPSGHSWEVQLRGCSIWYELTFHGVVPLPRNHWSLTFSKGAVELIRREILKQHPEATGVNAVLIDFLLYDLAKEQGALGESCLYQPTRLGICWIFHKVHTPTSFRRWPPLQIGRKSQQPSI